MTQVQTDMQTRLDVLQEMLRRLSGGHRRVFLCGILREIVAEYDVPRGVVDSLDEDIQWVVQTTNGRSAVLLPENLQFLINQCDDHDTVFSMYRSMRLGILHQLIANEKAKQ